MKKLTAILVTLGVIGSVGVVGVKESCVDDKGITFFPAEEVVVREQVQEEVFMSEVIYGKVVYRDVVVETGKICFQNSEDYETAKNGYIDAYVNKTPEERVDYLLTPESKMLGDFLTHETEKVGTVTFELDEGNDIILKYIQAVNKL